MQKNSPDTIEAIELALPLVRDWDFAVDGGAHRGRWTECLAQRFGHVHAFDPDPDMIFQLQFLFKRDARVIVHPYALWETAARVSLRHDLSCFCYVMPTTAREHTQAVSIDSLQLPNCGLIKLDLEGAETMALRGAIATMQQCKPVVIVDCGRHAARYGFSAEDPGKLLEAIGAREFARHGPDRIYAWPI